MKRFHPHPFSGTTRSRWLYAMLVPFAVSVVFATSAVGQLVAAPAADTVTPATKQTILTGKIMSDLPRYDASPVVVAETKPVAETPGEVVTLAPLVVQAIRVPKLRESELLTRKAYAAGILKEYDRSIFALFQHRESIRLENLAAIESYADSLFLVGDIDGGRAIKRESSRLFLRPHDPESEYVDSLFNARFR